VPGCPVRVWRFGTPVQKTFLDKGELTMPDRTVIITIKGNVVRIDDPDMSGIRGEYEQYQQDLINQWRNAPTGLIDIPDSGGHERAAHACNNALVNELIKNAPPPSTPIGKLVI